MAITLNGSSQYLYTNTFPSTFGYVGFWMKTSEVTNINHLWGTQVDGVVNRYKGVQYRPDVSGNMIYAYSYGATGQYGAYGRQPVNVDQWFHVLCRWYSTAGKVFYGHGQGGVYNGNDPGDLGTHDVMTIGVLNPTSPTYYFNGSICDLAIWANTGISFTAQSIDTLSWGTSPLLVRPDDLMAYYPLVDDSGIDIVGGYHLTAVGSPTVVDGPPQLVGLGRASAPSLLASTDSYIFMGTVELSLTVEKFGLLQGDLLEVLRGVQRGVNRGILT